MSQALLQVSNLRTAFQTDAGLLTAVDGVDFSIKEGETVGLVGESGCGKSVTAMSLVGLLPQPAGRVLEGSSIAFRGEELTSFSDERRRELRGKDIGVIFQEPMTALNPVHRIGKQLMELFFLHGETSKEAARKRAIEALTLVGIPDPERRVDEYPHQLSGGMRQRVVIALALALRPSLVIADEPTTALDVTVQAQILDLLENLQQEIGTAVLMITHDLGVIAETCQQVVVMYAGRIVEKAPVEELFANPRHAYTRRLLGSIPRLDHPRKTLLPTIPGRVPALDKMPAGSRFVARSGLPHTEEHLTTRFPLKEIAENHWVESCPVCSAPPEQQDKWLKEAAKDNAMAAAALGKTVVGSEDF